MPSSCPIISRYKKSHSPHTFPLSALQGNEKICIFVLRDAIFVNGKREFSLGADYADFTDILFVKSLLFTIL